MKHHKKHHHKHQKQDWDTKHLRHFGKFEDYKSAAPDGYKEHIVWNPPSPKTPEQEKIEEQADIVKEAKGLAKESEHKHKKMLAQKNKEETYTPVYPVAPGAYREHAWNDEQYHNSNEGTWEEETKSPSGYQNKLIPGFYQKKTYPAGTHSWIEPYNQRDHAWS